jgi:hypothetical protein
MDAEEVLIGGNGMNESLLAPSTSTFNDTSFHTNYTVYYDGDELYEVPVSIVILLSLLYGAISVAALIGNFLVLWVVSVSLFMFTTYNNAPSLLSGNRIIRFHIFSPTCFYKKR